MKYITVKLTEDQADVVYELLAAACLENTQDEHYYSFLHRLRVKVNKARRLAKAKQS